jgi:hydroxyethylthiazole kinase-like uncharacterized protein yjeF
MFPSLSQKSVPNISKAQFKKIIMLATGKYGLDNRLLIEHIGRNLVDMVNRVSPAGNVLVVAGRGNNGSGGLAAARLLAGHNRNVWVVPTHESENYSGGPREQLEYLSHYPNIRVKSGLPKMKFGCIIDAAIGTGLEGPPRGRTQDVITVLNSRYSGSCIISVDIPTGFSVDTGSAIGDAVRATFTLSACLPKPSIKPGGYVGRLFVGDMGIPPELLNDLNLTVPPLPGFLVELL